MPNSKQIVYLSQSQYAELIANGTITVDGVTVTYDENDIYVTPQAEPVTDACINGTSITTNGVANIPLSKLNTFGVLRAQTDRGINYMSDGVIQISSANGVVKAGTNMWRPVVPTIQHESTFYGLAKAAGHDEKDSTEPVGTYTPEAKGAIQSMLGVSDLIATAENSLVASKAYAIGDIFTANGKLYKATAAIAADAAIIPEVEGEEVAGANCVETSVGEGFVKFTNLANATNTGVVKIEDIYGVGMFHDLNAIYNDKLYVNKATDSQVKAELSAYRPIVPQNQHISAFYGLAKAAGADEKDSTLPVGQYTDTAKSAIRTMIGASSTNVIAVQDTQPTDTDTKIWLPETAETPVQIPTMDDLEDYVQKTDIATANSYGLVKSGGTAIGINSNGQLYVNTNSAYGVRSYSGTLAISEASAAEIKTGTTTWKSLTPGYQHTSTFYGLAKAAGDTTQSASDNAVGTYTDEAKAAIKSMIGVNVEDVQVDGTSVISNGIANVPIATNGYYGLVKPTTTYGVNIINGYIGLRAATDTQIKEGSAIYATILPNRQHQSVFYGLAKASGDTTQSSSSNAVGVYTDNAKASIKSMLGIVDGSTGTVDVSGTTPTITAVENTRYVCGEVTSLSFTPAASGICIVRFTSGSTVTVLTLPSTVKFPEWFDSTSLETNTIYEICITDGVYGAVMSWAL